MLGSRQKPANSPTDPHAKHALVALCLTVTVSYGVLYYAFTVLAPAIVEDTTWSATAVTAAFSIGSLFGAVAGIAAGRLLQRRGPRLVMTAGSVLGAASLVLVGLAPTYPVFVLAWLLAGAASAGTFYPPAFAALTQWFGSDRVRAVTTLTLVAGFASTIFAPLTAALSDAVGWRGTYLMLAVIMAAVSVPAHLLALRLPWHPQAAGSEHQELDHTVLTSRPFILITASGALASLAMYASLVHLVALMLDQGHGVQLAAWALGLSGAGQVAGRLLYPSLDRWLAPNPRAALIIATLAVTLIALALTPSPAIAMISIAVLSGAARGLFTLIGATVIADHWGAERYAALNGVYNAPLGIAAALAPAFGAVVSTATGSHAALFAILGGVAFVSAALAVIAGQPSPDALGHSKSISHLRQVPLDLS